MKVHEFTKFINQFPQDAELDIFINSGPIGESLYVPGHLIEFSLSKNKVTIKFRNRYSGIEPIGLTEFVVTNQEAISQLEASILKGPPTATHDLTVQPTSTEEVIIELAKRVSYVEGRQREESERLGLLTAKVEMLRQSIHPYGKILPPNASGSAL